MNSVADEDKNHNSMENDYDYDTVEVANSVAEEDENHNTGEDDHTYDATSVPTDCDLEDQDYESVDVADYVAEDDENHNTVDQPEDDNWWVHYPSEDEYCYEESDGAWDDEEEASSDE